ncbi:MAG: TolC family protein, partial [Opitutae bacterium]|nr:TolC family protein [Opitutae bacterium]
MNQPSFSFLHRPLAGLLLLAAIARAEETAPPGPAPVSLPAIVGEITAHNPELKFYEAEIAAVKAASQSAGALNDPSISLGVGRKRISDVTTGTFLGAGHAWSVSVTQTFEWPGRLALRKAIAN